MKSALRLCLLGLLLAAVSASAGVVGSTNPSLFPNTIDWCAQATFACGDNAPIASYQYFSSAWGDPGIVGLAGPFFSSTDVNFQALQAGTNLFGSSFPDGMGVLYNGVSTLGNSGGAGSAFLFAFARPQYGFGAYLQTFYYGPFTAEVILVDQQFNFLGAAIAYGNSSDQSSDLMFLGALSSQRDVFGAIVIAVDQSDIADFALGQAGLATPEPSSLLLLAPSALGLAGVIRRRLSRKSQEVQ